MPQLTEKPPTRRDAELSSDSRICWIEVKQYPYQPDHQVELLHLQAEADALILQLQATSQKRTTDQQQIPVRS